MFQTAPSQTTENINGMAEPTPTTNGPKDGKGAGIEEMTSKDYYFDSYAHFGIHEVLKRRLLHCHFLAILSPKVGTTIQMSKLKYPLKVALCYFLTCVYANPKVHIETLVERVNWHLKSPGRLSIYFVADQVVFNSSDE